MNTPLVSVLIPTCNRAELLPTAISSVLAQTFGDFELLVVDDASNEPIEDLVSAFKDKRVRWIRHASRKGGSAARNTGIRNTTGKFVAFLDDDDEWYPEKLARQTNLLQRGSSDVGAIYTGYAVVDRETGQVLSRMIPAHRGNVAPVLLRGNCVGPTSSFLVRRECFEAVGIFDEKLPSFQEYDLWMRLSRAYEFDYVSECLFNYYVHSQRIWTNPEAILKGVDMLWQKYGTSKVFGKTCSTLYLSVAVQFCESGQSKNARDALRSAISLYPLDSRHYLYFLLSFLSQDIYQKVQRSKARMISLLTSFGNNGVDREVRDAESQRYHSNV